MKLLNLIKGMFFLTVLALIYIHLQTRIFDLAYQGKQRERQINDLTEQNGVMSCDIQRLKSSDHLGTNLLSAESTLKFLDSGKVLQIVTAKPEVQSKDILSSSKPRNPQAVLSFISARFSREAQAKEESDTGRLMR
jgi:hypothetical protein